MAGILLGQMGVEAVRAHKKANYISSRHDRLWISLLARHATTLAVLNSDNAVQQWVDARQCQTSNFRVGDEYDPSCITRGKSDVEAERKAI